MGYILWGYKGSGDHGCEDWLRGVCKLLPEKPDVYSQCPEEDWRYGVGEVCGIYPSCVKTVKERLKPGDYWVDAAPGDGSYPRCKGVSRVLWGWSAEKLTCAVLRKLRRYDLVVVTEKRSFRRLQQAGLGDRLQLREDPAFLVHPVVRSSAIPLPEDTLGLCLSYPGEAQPVLYESYCRLLQWILKETDFSVALIPYCVRRGENDLLLQAALYRQFRDSGRVYLRKDGSSRLLRGDLSMCRCCVGFYGAVAAWSCGVPALCLSGSSKNLGLSHDIWGSSYESVCPWEGLREENTLAERVCLFLQKEAENRRQLRGYLQRIGAVEEGGMRYKI